MKIRRVEEKTVSVSWPDQDYEELQNAVKLVVITKCPSKYRLVDTETGEIYSGSEEDNMYMSGYKNWKKL